MLHQHVIKQWHKISINWIMMKNVIPIPGTRNVQMANDNFNLLGWTLTNDETNRLDDASMIADEFSNGGFELK